MINWWRFASYTQGQWLERWVSPQKLHCHVNTHEKWVFACDDARALDSFTWKPEKKEWKKDTFNTPKTTSWSKIQETGNDTRERMNAKEKLSTEIAIYSLCLCYHMQWYLVTRWIKCSLTIITMLQGLWELDTVKLTEKNISAHTERHKCNNCHMIHDTGRGKENEYNWHETFLSPAN